VLSLGVDIEGGSRARVLALSGIFAALTSVGGFVSIPFFPVPLTLQTFFVYLAVLKLKKHAYISQAIYLGIGAVGLPVFARGMGGYAVLVGPTGGFLFGFLLGAFVSGQFLEAIRGRSHGELIAIVLCSALTFLTGMLWLAYWLGGDLTAAAWVGVIPFLPGDAIKLAMAAIIGKKLRL
jgi:biotin transport system substrate-specific component